MPNDKRPPKAWFDKKLKEVKEGNPGYTDEQARATVGKIFWENMSGSEREKTRKESTKKIAAEFKDLFSSKYAKWVQLEVELLAANNYGQPASIEEANSNIEKAIGEVTKTLESAVKPEVKRLVDEVREDILESIVETVPNAPDLQKAGPDIVAPQLHSPQVPAPVEGPELSPAKKDEPVIPPGASALKKASYLLGGKAPMSPMLKMAFRKTSDEDDYQYFERGDKVIVSMHKSDPGKGLSYPHFSGKVIEEGSTGGWDVVDVIPDKLYLRDPNFKTDDGIVSVYCFDIEVVDRYEQESYKYKAFRKTSGGAIEVIDTLKDEIVQHIRADDQGEERYQQLLEQYGQGREDGRYVVQLLDDSGEVIKDNQGSGGATRDFGESGEDEKEVTHTIWEPTSSKKEAKAFMTLCPNCKTIQKAGQPCPNCKCPIPEKEEQKKERMEPKKESSVKKLADFMEPDVEEGEWVIVDGDAGTEAMPAEYINLEDVEELNQKLESGERSVSVEGTSLRDFMEGNEVYAVEVKHGFGARLSAPGYLDATEWTVFDSEQEAIDYLEEMYGDDSGEEE